MASLNRILRIYVLLFKIRFCNALGFVQYSPILSIAAKYYVVSDNSIVWFSICYYVTYFLFAPFSIRPLERRLDYTLFFAAFLTALGILHY